MALTQVTTHGIKDATVATADISNDSITSAKIIANSITSSELANGAVTNTEVASDAAIDVSKLSGVLPLAGGTLTGNLIISSTGPQIQLVDTDNNSDFQIKNENGLFRIRDITTSLNRLTIASDGTVNVEGNLDVGAGIDVTGNISATGDITITNDNPRIFLTDTNNNDDFSIRGSSGMFRIRSETDAADRLVINSDGHVDIAGNVDFGAGIDVTGEITGTSHIDLPDNAMLKLGTGDDLQLYHDGSNSYIKNTFATGDLILDSAQNFYIKHSGEIQIQAVNDGAVNLYYDNSKKFETTSAGAAIIGSFFLKDASANTEIYYDSTADRIIFKDNKKAVFGDSSDLQIFHDGTDSFINNFTGNLELRPKSGEAGVLMVPNGSTELYYDGVKKLETLTGGVNIVGSLTVNGSAISSGGLSNIVEDTSPQLGGDLQSNGNDIDFADNDAAFFGTGNDLKIFHSGSNSQIIHSGTGNVYLDSIGGSVNLRAGDNAGGVHNSVVCNLNEDVELYYDNSKKFETYSGGVRVHGELLMQNNSLYLNDNAKLRLGTGQDLNIYHDGSHSRLVNNQGLLLLQSTGVRLLNAGGTENMLIAIPDSQVELYFDNSKKFQTSSQGCYFLGDDTHWSQGHMNPWNNNDYNLGSASYRWANAFISQAIDFQDSAKAQFGNSDDLQIYHNGTLNVIDCANAQNLDIKYGSEYLGRFGPNGSVDLYYNNSKKFNTTSSGVDVHGAMEIEKGGSSGTALNINTTATSGATRIKFNESGSTKGQIVYSHDNNQIELAGDSGQHAAILVNFTEYALRAIANGATELYYNGSEKFQTTDTGNELFGKAQFTQSSNSFVQKLDATNSGFSTNIIKIHATRGAASNWAFLAADSNHGGGADREFTLRGDGHAYADNSWNANGADYAEYFESSTGSAIAVGTTVVLENNKVRAATSSDAVADIIGVVRPKEPAQASTTIGNAAWNKWQGKYLTDDFDRYILDEHNVIEWTDADGKEHSYGSHAIPSDVNVPSEPTIRTQDENGNKFTHYRLNPNYNSERTYVPRHDRDEWVIVGLVGQVKLLKGQAANDRWIKMKDVSDTVQEYFIR